MKDSQGDPRGVSRRGFLTGTGAAAAAVAGLTAELAPPAAAQPPTGAPALGPAPVVLELTVNGKKVVTKVEPRVTLLDALRNHLDVAGNYLDVTGCKRVCDRGTCGACTVTLNGRTVYSCTTLALEARGADVKTAESLGLGRLDPVPAAFADNDAQQCGFCTPGFVVSMRAAFDKNPNATPEQIEAALSGNICRCGTYEQMRHAIVQLCRKGG
ncbi:MAG TPA: (2Fe-2S)-binding protein [Gemmataceae bacterium]|nr:(2Fe-2S)-binding protein [Gemmataceae bacterium]